MDATGIIIMLWCFVGPLVPPILGTVVGTVYDAVTARRVRERRAAAARARAVPSAAA
ncbi:MULTISPECIES: hypothetical protein [unclassified Aeromicrobium]|jgi:hypothetical protein|uniref:hypothetical protein n=1 Tax=unclassified Aeromicrobium TaxID=2633570 RepID=UPI002096D1D4|nr:MULTISPECIES: hypothetical protein [unclassified Aeromicrobium]MCO7239556.1 hypothetical protein [Aeromicrobium sp. CnD17-E]MDR6117299.1 hypothetical protein [Aeromicrobium sp. SORGH_AS_0981]